MIYIIKEYYYIDPNLKTLKTEEWEALPLLESKKVIMRCVN